jgi:hypothetical protein
MTLSVWCPHCGRKANSTVSSIGTLKRCPQCRRQHEVTAPAVPSRPKRNPFAGLIGCLGLAVVGIAGMVCCGGFSAFVHHTADAPNGADKSAMADRTQGSPPAMSAASTPMSPDALGGVDSTPVPQSVPQPPAHPLPKDEADAVDGILVARDLLNGQRKDKALAKLADVVKHYPGTRAAKEAQAWLDEMDRRQSSRLADVSHSLEVAASKPYLKGLVQIPATVIDKGILRNVPYQSFRAGDYEVNVYGDPDQPAGLEIGINRGLLKSMAARRNCIDFVGSVMSDPADQKLLTALKLMRKDMVILDGLTVEVTTPMEEDSYGGWWVSAYREKALDHARASDKELAQIAVQRGAVTPFPEIMQPF